MNRMRTILALIGAIAIVVVLSGVASYPRWGCSWRAHTIRQTLVYSSQVDAAYADAINRPAAVPLLTLPAGGPVAVVWDTYGKDYWACYVREPTGNRGWVLCTELKRDTGVAGA